MRYTVLGFLGEGEEDSADTVALHGGLHHMHAGSCLN